MNRRIFIAVTALLAVAAVLGAPSKKTPPKDYKRNIIVWGGAGYGSLCHTVSGWKAVGGPGAEIGVGFEYDKRNWILYTGVEMQYIMSVSRARDPFRVDAEFLYTPASSPLYYHYDFSSYEERNHALLANVPLMAGYRFAEKWFVTAGVRIGFGVYGRANTRAACRVSFSDPVFAEEVDQGHYTGAYDVGGKSPLRWGVNIAPSVEIGRYLNEHMRLSLFGECNALNMNHTATDRPLLDLSAMSRPDDIQVHSFFGSDRMADGKVHNFLVGVRFACLFSVDKEPPAGKQAHATSASHQKPVQKPKPEPVPLPEVKEEVPAVEPDTIRFGDIVIRKDEAVVLQNLLFEFRTATIIEASARQLETLLEMMQSHPDTHILIVGHTDNVGTDAFNDRLSRQRAEAVKRYLTEHGIAPERIRTEGHGSREPVDTNDTDDGRQRNRRVEFTIINP